MLPNTADAVVIGAGVMGTSAAYHLAAGIKRVVLLEKARFLGMQATGKCAGGIRYQFSTEINVRRGFCANGPGCTRSPPTRTRSSMG